MVVCRYILLGLLTTGSNGASSADHSLILNKREATIPLDPSRPFKLNADTASVFRVAYSPERLVKLGDEAARETSAFSTEDRMGLVSDAFELAKSEVSKTSGGLTNCAPRKNVRPLPPSQVLDKIHSSANWVERDAKDVADWLGA